MRRRVWGRVALISAVTLSLALSESPTRAAGWASQLFSEQGTDFGAVPRGVKLRHSFVLTNRTSEPITIVDVRASCGCTTGHATASKVPPGETATVEAEMDTRNFVGKKATVLYVTLVSASGREAEVRLGVSSTILSDIVLNPGTIDFGTVTRGQAATQTLTIDRIGMPAWQVRRMVSACQAIEATLTETTRNGKTVSYTLKAWIKPDAPTGTIRDEIRLFSNDKESPIIPIQVTGTVRGDLSASPSVLSMGKTNSAGAVQGRFLVRASKPFTVRSIEGEGDGFSASADDSTPKPVHIVTVNYRPDEGSTRGDLRRVFRLHTDLVGEIPLELTATLHVDP